MSLPSLEELRKQILLAPITDIEPHVKRGAFLLIDPSLDLAEVGLSMAENDENLIQKYLDEQKIVKVDLGTYEVWRQEKTFFHFLIIQPFVIGQKALSLNKAPDN